MAAKADSYSCEGALSRKLTPYLNNSELSDITVKVGQKSFPAHRLVLAVWSEKLTKMMDETSGNIIELCTDATEREIGVFEKVLRFFYTGEMTFTAENVKMVMNLAGRLALTQLSSMAQKWVGEMIDRGSMVSAVSWLRDAAECTCLHSETAASAHWRSTSSTSPRRRGWDSSAEELMGIIGQDDIVADDEKAVITRVDAWLMAKGRPEDNQELYREIASKIRLPFVETISFDPFAGDFPSCESCHHHEPVVDVRCVQVPSLIFRTCIKTTTAVAGMRETVVEQSVLC